MFFIGKISNIQGFSSDSVETIGAFSYLINYDMTKVIIGMYLICVIGTIIDTSISVSSSMNEVLENNPKINEKELYKSGMNVGGDILSTTINTLFFAIRNKPKIIPSTVAIKRETTVKISVIFRPDNKLGKLSFNRPKKPFPSSASEPVSKYLSNIS